MSITTYCAAKGFFNGLELIGEIRDKPLRFVTEDGSYRISDIFDIKVIYQIKDVHSMGSAGIIEISNGIQIPWDEFSQYKSHSEALTVAEMLTDLFNGLEVNLRNISEKLLAARSEQAG